MFASALTKEIRFTMFLLYLFTTVILLLLPVGCYSREKRSVDVEREVTMALLHIAFQEGFTGDTVIVRVNGEEVFHKENVKTRLQIGYADSFEMTIEEGPVNIEVLLPLKNLSETIMLQLSTALYVGVSIQDGRIDYRISHEPFGYL